MALEPRSPSVHNRSMGTRIPHPLSTNYHEGHEFTSPPAKRLKSEASSRATLSAKTTSPSKCRPKRRLKDEIPDSEDDGDELDASEEEAFNAPRATQLEATLPAVQTDEEAIEAYEAYKAGEVVPDEGLADNGNGSAASRMEDRSWVRGRSSIYVDAFNLALDTVLEEEGHLFNDAEHDLFRQWRELGYESQYLYVRLFLRKTSKWFRVNELPYYSDIADIDATVLDLQRERNLPTVEAEEEIHPGELDPPEVTILGDTFQFAECSSEHITTLDEASSLLLLDELKQLAKDAKVKGKNKRELLQNFRRTSGKQTGLGFRELRRTETEGSTGTNLSEDDTPLHDDDEDGDASSGSRTPATATNRDAHFTKKILDRTGRCIRLSLTPLKLFERVHLVFYRSTEWTEKSLTTLILAKISRRNFPEYIVSRSTTIFESRALLLEFEASLRTQFKVDNILEFNGTPNRKSFELVMEIFEAVYPRWKVLLAIEQRKEDRVYESGEGAYLRRFSPAWVYTRIVHKGLQPLARFKDHFREHSVLCELLDQRLFHAARRGAWYQRKALLEEHYMHALTPSEGRAVEANKKHWKRVALMTCEQGLQDKECHVIYHYDLQKRIKKLEKQLHVPVREQHDFGHVRLGKAIERDVAGIKLEKEREPTPSRSLSRKGSVGNRAEKPPPLVHQPSGGPGAKTIWLDHLDTSLPVSVESMCLSHYRHVLGYKGYHSEGGILRTLFGLLFYDILFTHPYIPNVFQTAYQTCPLDLHTDSFFPARTPEILGRINDINNGEASRIMTEVWDREFERRTCVVGVRWDGFEREDLLELVSCFEPQALGTIMLVMSQEYQSRGGGVPDLVLWKVLADEENADNGDENPMARRSKGEVVFAEVKSANDRLSDTQRLWISVLLSAGVKVELCHAVAGEVRRE
jgi:fanconi-associated nuclease 1